MTLIFPIFVVERKAAIAARKTNNIISNWMLSNGFHSFDIFAPSGGTSYAATHILEVEACCLWLLRGKPSRSGCLVLLDDCRLPGIFFLEGLDKVPAVEENIYYATNSLRAQFI